MQYIKIYLATASITLITFFCLGWYIQPVVGDLTRQGNFSERDFGWNAQQPIIKTLENPNGNPPDVIVLGDSFSASNQWQSVVMQKTGKNLLTFHWNSLGHPSCLESWIKSIKNNYPSANEIIIQSIERHYVFRFKTVQKTCNLDSSRYLKIKAGQSLAHRGFEIDSVMPDPIYALLSIANQYRSFQQHTVSGESVIAPLNRSNLFSNKRSDYLLYFKNDNLKKDWTSADVETAAQNIKQIEQVAQVNGLNLTVAIVPDKSTAYRQYLKTPQFSKEQPNLWHVLSAKNINHVSLDNALIPSTSNVKDLYLPNDTHLSTRGFILMAEYIANFIKRSD
jgi:SGNH hydrolase-like domain, acetyltransferase AlgX